MTASPARWAVRPPAPPEAVRELSRALSLPPVLAAILHARGLDAGALEQLQPPLALSAIPDLKPAAERLEAALRERKRILVHGDYDADGISGTALLCLGLRALGGDVTPFIPNRLGDGYGVHPARVPEHAERAELFLTVDCGVSNLDEIRRLQAHGVEVIVSDHHQPGEELPACLLVHPRFAPNARPGLPELTGAGVAYHLLWALHERLGLEPPLEYADLATLGTVADVAPLLGENRALVQAGLKRMTDSRWPGLRAMLQQSRLRGPPSARDVAFVLAPRLNAAGRLGEADLGLELLMTASARRALELAVYLEARNHERRKLQDEMYASALERADPDAPALVLADDGWHPGVMGIVASKLLERFYKPVYVTAQGKGSVRSTPGISAVAGLRAAQAHLLRYGGHSQAAGFTLRHGALEAFRAAIYAYAKAYEKPERLLVADALLRPDEIDDDLWRATRALEPYGEGHAEPRFALCQALESARAVGQNRATLQLRLGGLRGVAWGQGERAAQLAPGAPLDVLVSLRENVWNERRSLEFLADALRDAAPLGFTRDFTEAPALGARVRRGGAPPGAERYRLGDPLPALEGGPLLLEALPPSDAPLAACAGLERLLSGTRPLHFALSSAGLAALEAALTLLPTLQDVRRAYVCKRRGQAPALDAAKASLVERVLLELELCDAAGRALPQQKRDPYRSDTLLASLLERYKLHGLLKAYAQLEDAAFAQALETLFGAPDRADGSLAAD